MELGEVEGGGPNYGETVGAGELQKWWQLLMEQVQEAGCADMGVVTASDGVVGGGSGHPNFTDSNPVIYGVLMVVVAATLT
ncbi:uncharacterized protein G2W53_003312 [Senna tora]|uniref:Uncharacterized protein n=1 Tax=Senna tora TaxID=362788 RepID=A0A834X9X2_9FABA|nr:uncharacterized protein G2W53_003312 [Senna tora]